MKKLVIFAFVLLAFSPVLAQPRPRVKPTPTPTPAPTPLDPVEQDKLELDAIAPLPPAERVAILQTWRANKPDSPQWARATEDLLRAHAAWGDELLKTGNTDAGLDQFELVLKECPKEISDRLFADVLLVMPTNLYLREQRSAATLAAVEVEKLVRPNAQRLLPLVTFYLSLEDGANAERLASEVAALLPESAAAQQALGAARHINLHLESALAGYQKAYELDPNSAATRRSLADMLRANGKPEAALALYRKQLEADPKDRLARSGVALSLLEAGQREEGEKELEAALTDEPRNLPLLAGAAYWYAARGENAKSLDLAQRAVQVEPRYTWGQIALARALAAQQRPFEAERALRFAQQYGRFPTLSYELATVLAGLGRYEEAAEELSRAFTVKDGKISALLAGREADSRDDFRDLLTPERRAGLFQPRAADSEANTRQLKSLLVLYGAMRPGQTDEQTAARAAREFGGGNDSMAAYRQLYAAHRLMRNSLAPQAVGALMGAAPAGVDNALDQPYAIVAVMADDYLRLSQTPAFANLQPTMTPAQRLALSRVVRGRVEDLAGWSYLAQGDTDEALVRFRRALSVLPENTSWWRSAQWHSGTALEAKNKPDEALAAYLKSYNKNAPDLLRRAVVERLYRQVKGTTDGLTELIGPAPVLAVAAPVNETAPAPAPETVVAPPITEATPAPAPEVTPEAKPVESSTPNVATPPVTEATPAPKIETPPVAAPSPTVEATPAPLPEITPTPATEPSPTPVPGPVATPTPDATPAPLPEITPTPDAKPATETEQPAPTPNATPAQEKEPPAPASQPTPTPEPEVKPTPETETKPTPEVTPTPTTPETETAPPVEPKKSDNNPEPEPAAPTEKSEPATNGVTRPRRVTPETKETPPAKEKKPDKPKKP